MVLWAHKSDLPVGLPPSSSPAAKVHSECQTHALEITFVETPTLVLEAPVMSGANFQPPTASARSSQLGYEPYTGLAEPL